MNELAPYQSPQLPDTLQDLSKFIMFTQEKVKSVKAEIRAIQKLKLAQEIYEQKMEEQRKLLEVILEADVRVGDLTIEMKKQQGKRTDAKLLPSSGKKLEKTKAQMIKELGFSTSQVGRFEKMAKNRDIVDAVIAESKTGETEATQGEVLRRIAERESGIVDMAQARQKKFDQDMKQLDVDKKVTDQFHDAVYGVLALPDDPESVRCFVRGGVGYRRLYGQIRRSNFKAYY